MKSQIQKAICCSACVYNPFYISETQWNQGDREIIKKKKRDDNEASISLRSQWVLSPVWTHPKQSWTAPVLETLSVERPRTSTVKQQLQTHVSDSGKCSLILDTHIIVISLWYQDVHLRALGTDDITVEGVLTQVDLAALCLVDGNGGNCSQHLYRDIVCLLTGMCGTICT